VIVTLTLILNHHPNPNRRGEREFIFHIATTLEQAPSRNTKLGGLPEKAGHPEVRFTRWYSYVLVVFFLFHFLATCVGENDHPCKARYQKEEEKEDPRHLGIGT